MPLYTLELALVFEAEGHQEALDSTTELVHDIQNLRARPVVEVLSQREPTDKEIVGYREAAVLNHPEDV